MKKTLITAAALFTLFISANAFSPKTKLANITTPKMEQSFLEEFGEQSNVAWSRDGNEMVHATFTVDNQTANAYFDGEGNFVCSTTEMQKEDLPLKLKLAVNRSFTEASINAVLLMNNPEETAYFLQVTDTKGTKVWKGYANGTLELFKKLK